MPLFRRRKAPAAVQANASVVDRRNLKIAQNQHRYHWQREVSDYVKHGPGIIGNYADTLEDKTKRATIIFESLNENGVWEQLHDSTVRALCRGVYSAFKNPNQTPSQLLARHTRLLATVGEVWIIRPTTRTGIAEFYVAHPFEMSDWNAATETRAGWVFWTNPFTGIKEKLLFGDGVGDQVIHSWVGEDDHPARATSELRRALPHIREFIAVRRRGVADSRSRLAMSEILTFGAGTEVYESGDENDPDNGMPMAVLDYIEMANMEEDTPYWERPPVGTQVPFPMMGEKPERVEVGRMLDPELVSHESQALLNISHALRCPTKWLVEGPGGSAKRNENDDIQNALIDDCIVPNADRALDDYNQLLFRPALQFVFDSYKITSIRADSIRATIDANSIRPRPDQSSLVFAAWDRGLASRAAVQSVTAMDLLDIPPGWTDWQFWQFVMLLKQPQGGSGVSVTDTTRGGMSTHSDGLPDQKAITAAADSVVPPFLSITTG